MTRFVGIDYSMSCPAMVLWDPRGSPDFSWFDCEAYYVTDTDKYVGSFGNVEGIRMHEWSTQEERFDFLADTFSSMLRPGDRVILEGYAMGAKGKVFHIGENTGVLKNRLWRGGVMYESVSPSVIKKHATGKGNSDKSVMNDFFVKETGIDLKKKMGMSDKNWSPSGDVVDAYYACSLARTYFNLDIDIPRKTE